MMIVLASSSGARAALLAAAGIAFVVRPSAIDERAAEAPVIARGGSPAEAAATLAEAKALAGSRAAAGALVIGADQTLDIDGERLTKPASRVEARDQLARLSGRTHVLQSAVAIARDGAVRWRHLDSARLTMRQLTEVEIDAYLAEVGDQALLSVGAYQVEGPAIRLFERIDGDFFTILGLPLLPLLAYLRREGDLAW